LIYNTIVRSKINIAILQLREKGVLSELEKKWWEEEGDVCDEDTADTVILYTYS